MGVPTFTMKRFQYNQKELGLAGEGGACYAPLLDFLPVMHTRPRVRSPALKQQKDWRRWGGNDPRNTGGADRSHTDELNLVIIFISQRHLPEPYLSGCQPLRHEQLPRISQSLSQTCTCDQVNQTSLTVAATWECGRVSEVTLSCQQSLQDNVSGAV